MSTVADAACCRTCGQALPREKYVYAPPRRGASMAQLKASSVLDVRAPAHPALCEHYLLEDFIKARGVGKKPPRRWS